MNHHVIVFIFGIIFLLELFERLKRKSIGYFVNRYMYLFWIAFLCLIVPDIYNFPDPSRKSSLIFVTMINILVGFTFFVYWFFRGMPLCLEYLANILKIKPIQSMYSKSYHWSKELKLHPVRAILYVLLFTLLINSPSLILSIHFLLFL